LQFERPWDRLVPAKSVRNANRGHRRVKKILASVGTSQRDVPTFSG
jgi:hypothetical protein